MFQKKPFTFTIIFIAAMHLAVAQNPSPDSTNSKTAFPYFKKWSDSYLSRFNYSLSPLLSLSPDSARTKVNFNKDNNTFSTTEKIGNNIELKKPQSLSFNEYSSLQNAALRRSIIRDIEKAQEGNSAFGSKRSNPLLAKNPIMDRLFGDKVPEFKPNGFITVDLGFYSIYTENPQLPLIQRKQTDFDFKQRVTIDFNNLFNGGENPQGENVNEEPKEDIKSPQISDLTNVLKRAGQAREKMNILGNFDTQSAFQFENKFKLNFKNEPEDILQKVELGNVSMPNRSQLIPGVQNLLGAKIGLKFGKLDIATVIAQQNSRTESIIINGGNQSRRFEIRCDNYEENKHFFLSQVFRDNYENSLKNLPMVTSGLRITRIEVYVTNRSSNVTSMRNLAGLADLGEKNPFKKDKIIVYNTVPSADNKTNDLYANVAGDPNFRSIDNTNNALRALGLDNGKDYDILRGAKRLTDREFEVQPELGYVSLLTPLRNDEVLAVAYEYTYKGRPYKVGELSEDYINRKEDEVIVLKLLKSSTIRNNLKNPMWNLMMKNIYTLSQGQIKKEGFQLRIVYKDDQSGLDSPNLKEGKNLANIPLIEALNLDKLNFNNDPLKDGNFDYIEGVSINEKNGRIIFPILEPFGSHLESKFETTEIGLKEKYVFNELYQKTLTDAQQVSLKNKFFLSGSVQVGSSEISLPLGASGSSVRIYAGGTELKEGVDYTVDSQIGRVILTNQSILSSGRQIRIEYEKPDIFQSQLRRLFGIRLDYTISRDIRIGGTFLNLRETVPGFITRTSIGNEPVNNIQWGVDVNLKKEVMGLTRLLDALPGIQTKEVSSILFNAEFAQLIPGVNNKKIKGSSMLDDFEYARNVNDLTRQTSKWRLGSTPKGILDTTKTILTDPYSYNYSRAKLAAYSVDPSTYINNGFGGGGGFISEEIKNQANNNIYTRSFSVTDVIPGRSTQAFTQQLPSTILDLAYFPKEPGMYNYNTDLDESGFLKSPEKSFGSVMRGITFDADFDNSNVEFIEALILDPFLAAVQDGTKNGNKANESGGKLLLQIGDISEDVIPDSRFNFENGIKKDSTSFSKPVPTAWGYAPRTQFITDAFDNQESTRLKQDVGLDGLSNAEERTFPHIKKYLDKISKSVVTDQDALKKIQDDPSKDDFKYFLDPAFDNGGNTTFLQRFQNYVGMENNAPPINNTETVSNQANTNLADKEDINQDNTINEVEDYYEYEIDFKKNQLDVGKGYIVDKIVRNSATWYLFRIPIKKPSSKGKKDLDGFKSIRFIRLVTTEWKEPVVLRFASLQFVSNQYRVYQNSLSDKGEIEKLETDNSVKFNVSSVNAEENGCPPTGDCTIKAGTTPYVVPPGFIRDRDFNTNIQTFQNEQSLKLSVENLKGGEARAIFKNTKADLNMYKRIKMFIHSENKNNLDGIGSAFLRIGTDLKNNYYEIEVPKLTNTINGSVNDPTIIWPKENEIDIPLSALRNLKLNRNRNNIPFNQIYGDGEIVRIRGTISGSLNEAEDSISREYIIRVKGNPDLSNILNIMIGLKNSDTTNKSVGKEFSAWFDELRVYGFDQEKGEAGVLSADIKLADIGTISINGNYRNYGYGGVQDRISSRSREYNQGFGIASTLDIDKFFPLNWGLSIPLFVNYDNQKVKPTFNPLDPDIRLKDAIDNKSIYQSNLSSKLVEESAITKGFNFTNVRKIKTKAGAVNNFYDIENFTFSYAQNQMTRSNILLAEYIQRQNRAGLSYQYQPKVKSWQPFKNAKGFDKPIVKNLKEFNLSLIPNTVGFRSDYDRSFISNTYRTADLKTEGVTPNVIKYFLGNRYYDAQWDLTKSININYTAQMTAIQDDVEEITNDEVSFFKGLKTLGRAKNYTQKIQATYTLPLDKFYLLDWLNVDSRFNNSYGFTAGSFQIKDENQDPFGNLLENGRELAFNGKVDFVKLYNKLKFLKLANTPSPPQQRFTRTPGDDEEIKLPPPAFTKNLTRLLMTVRGINFNLSLIETTLLPGFLPSPKYFGLDTKKGNAPGLGFVMGSQNRNILDRATNNKWLSPSIIQNNPFTQTRGLKFDFSTSLEPFKGFRMQIKGNLSRGDSYQEMYRPETKGGAFTTLSPVRNGNFSMSFWSFNTSFKKLSGDSASLYQYDIFDTLVANRQKVLDRLKILNPDSKGSYDLNSQDVLIPAFFSAYSGQSLDKIFSKAKKRGSQTFNPFLAFPMPNWRIDYQGLEKLPGFNRLFNSITISHSYSSTYSVGNFTSSLDYESQVLNLSIRDYPLGTKTTNPIGANPMFIPTFIMSTITMEERFSPLIGVQFTTKKSFTGSFNWNKERKAALNLSNAQVAETNGNDFVFSTGIKKSNIKLPLRKADGNYIVLKNELNFTLQVTSRDLKVLQRRLDGDAVPTSGNYSLQIRPQFQYQINNRINLGMYFERSVNTPFTSLPPFASRTSRFGFNARFNLSD
jgi:cell surface protein SprA